MTNTLVAAFISTNTLLSAGGEYDSCSYPLELTNVSSTAYMNVRNCAIIQREITCPHCGKVSTNDVDVTDMHNYYENREKRIIEGDGRLMREFYNLGKAQGMGEMSKEASEICEKHIESAYYDGFKEGYRRGVKGMGDEIRKVIYEDRHGRKHVLGKREIGKDDEETGKCKDKDGVCPPVKRWRKALETSEEHLK